MVSIAAVTLEVTDLNAANDFYAAAFGLDERLRLGASDEQTTGFRGFTLSLVVSQPANVNNLFDSAVNAGATALKPASKSFWGFGGVLLAPDGTIWKVTTSEKKDRGPASRQIDQLVLLLGVANVGATRQFYVERGLTVARSFGSRYVEFATDESSPIKLALYPRKAAAKDAGVAPDGTGSHRLTIATATTTGITTGTGPFIGPFTDPDGFVWRQPAPTLELASRSEIDSRR